VAALTSVLEITPLLDQLAQDEPMHGSVARRDPPHRSTVMQGHRDGCPSGILGRRRMAAACQVGVLLLVAGYLSRWPGVGSYSQP
jgi:hypothetical protein